jgi:hypothetical protein
MKTNNSVILALILWFLFFASNVFASLKSPYPRKTDHIIVIVDGGVNYIVDRANRPKVP